MDSTFFREQYEFLHQSSMNLLKKFFGSKRKKLPSIQTESSPEITPLNEPATIRVFDAYGRELFITRQQWRDNVLLGNVENNWDNADKLAGLIVQSLQDNFIEEMVKPAERLQQLENGSERSAVLLSIVYLKTGHIDDSEQVLRQYISQNGESGAILVNLAKVYAERGDDEVTMTTLWNALKCDPNQENGFAWYEVIHREKGGEQAGLDALTRIAALPGSWRAQIWLARAELRAQRIDQAMALYREALVRTPKPAPTDLLMQMSGDLGNAGCLAEILHLAEPEFDPAVHGLQVGNNLIKANFDLDRFEQARHLLNQLYSLKRPDWRENLSYWDTEIAKVTVAKAIPPTVNDLKVGLLNVSGPVWLRKGTSTDALYPKKPSIGCLVSFLGSTAEKPQADDQVVRQLADPPGRMSRAVPLFLSEQIHLLTNASTQTIVPWIEDPHSGFALSGRPWEASEAVEMVQRSEPKSDYVVITHLVVAPNQWTIQLWVIKTQDCTCFGHIAESFPIETPTPAIQQLARQLLDLLSRQSGIESEQVSPNYSIPVGAQFPLYLLHLEQLLAVRCNSMSTEKSEGLSGERDIVEGNIKQCLDVPSSVNVRLLLANTLRYMKEVRPDILPEFEERIAMLQIQFPLPEPAHSLVQQIVEKALVD